MKFELNSIELALHNNIFWTKIPLLSNFLPIIHLIFNRIMSVKEDESHKISFLFI